MEFQKRLVLLRNKKNINQTDLGKAVGVGKTTISNYETGYSSPDLETATKIADYFGVTVDYILGRTNDPGPKYTENSDFYPGDKPKPLDYIGLETVVDGGTTVSELKNIIYKIENKHEPNLSTEKIPTKRVPIIGRIPAGRSSYAEEEVEGWMIIPAALNADYLLRVHGDSMIGADIEQGDLVACRQVRDDALPGQIVVANVNGDEAVLKYIVHEDNQWKLRAANSDYSDVVLNEDEDRIIAVVEGIVKIPREQDPQETRALELFKKLSPKKREQILGLLEVMREDE